MGPKLCVRLLLTVVAFGGVRPSDVRELDVFRLDGSSSPSVADVGAESTSKLCCGCALTSLLSAWRITTTEISLLGSLEPR